MESGRPALSGMNNELRAGEGHLIRPTTKQLVVTRGRPIKLGTPDVIGPEHFSLFLAPSAKSSTLILLKVSKMSSIRTLELSIKPLQSSVAVT